MPSIFIEVIYAWPLESQSKHSLNRFNRAGHPVSSLFTITYADLCGDWLSMNAV